MFLAQVVGRRFARSDREGRLEKLKTRRKSKTEGLQDLPKVLWGEASLVGLVARKTQTVLHKVHCSACSIFIHHNLFIMYYILHYNVVLLKALLAKDRPDFIIFALTMRIKIRAEAFS